MITFSLDQSLSLPPFSRYRISYPKCRPPWKIANDRKKQQSYADSFAEAQAKTKAKADAEARAKAQAEARTKAELAESEATGGPKIDYSKFSFLFPEANAPPPVKTEVGLKAEAQAKLDAWTKAKAAANAPPPLPEPPPVERPAELPEAKAEPFEKSSMRSAVLGKANSLTPLVTMPKAKGAKTDPEMHEVASNAEGEELAAQVDEAKAKQRAEREAAENAARADLEAAREAALAARPPVEPDNRDWNRFKKQFRRDMAKAEKEHAKAGDGFEWNS